MNKAYLSLGSNEGDRLLWLQKAMDLIERECGTVTAQSPVYETAAWGLTDQPGFLNQVIAIDTTCTTPELLTRVLAIETALGRVREVKWGPRIIDIDILLFNEDIIDTPTLKVPHPYIQDRRFTLVPLATIAPYYVHPLLGKTITELLADCPDKLEVTRVS